MKYPLPNQPQYKVQHYLGRTVGEMLLDPTAQRFLNSGLTSSQLVLTAATGVTPPTPGIVFNDNNSSKVGAISMFKPGGLDMTTIISDGTAAPSVTGRGNFIWGSNAFFNATTARDSVIIGANAGLGILTSEKNVVIGSDSLDTNFIGTIGSVNVVIGTNNFDGGTTSSFGNANTILGSFNGGTGPIGNDNIIIGMSNGAGGGLSNTTIISSDGGVSTTLSNIVILGTNQNVIIKGGGTPADNGSALQVHGTMTTVGAAPLTAGAGAMDFGKIKTASSTVSTTKYWEVVVDGALIKVCIN